MALGDHAFEALGFGFNDLHRKTYTPWGEVEVAYRLAALHWLGPKMEEITIKGVLFPEEFGGQGSLEGLRQAALAGEPQMLVTYAGEIKGQYVIEHISEDRSFIRGDGLPRKNAYEIKLKKYEGGGGLLGGLIPVL